MTPAQWMGVDTGHLVEATPGHHLERETAGAFEAMRRAAEADGIGLDIASSHRDFQRQCHIWNRKWRGELPLFARSGERLDPASLDDNEKLHAILTWSALPGGSRHHWGTDLDVYDQARCAAQQHTLALVPQEYEAGGPCFELNQWLQKNMREFGFYRPYAEDNGGVAPEPWHLSYQPVSDAVAEQLDVQTLAAFLSEQDLQGKACILAALPAIFTRYTLNQGLGAVNRSKEVTP